MSSTLSRAGSTMTALLGSIAGISLIVGGMGPVDPLTNDSAKLFAGVYALYCGVVFIATAGLLIAPVDAYFLHRLHLDQPR